MKYSTYLVLLFVVTLVLPLHASRAVDSRLKCKPDGTFKVVMFADTQDDEEMDPRTTALMEKVLDEEKPDMVVIGGDCISGGGCETVDQVKQAISHIAYPMEKRKIPWAIVFGNHDQEHFPKTKLAKDQVMNIYESYPWNVNKGWQKGIYGVGNKDVLVRDTAGKSTVFALWLLDSNEYAPKAIGGYDWIHSDQITWYIKTSKELEKKNGKKIPGIMFFHIPLCEYSEMVTQLKIADERNEPECPSKINSGLFAAILDRQDIKGVFVGHDHVNSYVADWMGVKLGYCSGAGYGTYNMPDDNPRGKRTRGGRVFLIKQSDPWNYETWMRYLDGDTFPKQP
jgi:hypothetical protein